MAEVHVTSWPEFLQAIQASGDTVHCPDAAIWDMNELEPDGHIGAIRFDCDAVYGHNATIKNLRYDGQIQFHSGFQLISDLHWENVLSNSQNQNSCFAKSGSGQAQMTLCKISGYFTSTRNTNARYPVDPISGFKLYRCGINIESPAVAFNPPAKMEYTNFLCQLPNAQTIYAYAGQGSPGMGHYFSSILTVAPNCVRDYSTAYASGCVFRGRKERLTSFWAPPESTYMSLYCTTDMQAMADSQGVIGVTEEQLRDANYLASIGFPMGVD
jgi:hypothetical protein